MNPGAKSGRGSNNPFCDSDFGPMQGGEEARDFSRRARLQVVAREIVAVERIAIEVIDEVIEVYVDHEDSLIINLRYQVLDRLP